MHNEKNIITREKLKKDLKHLAKADVYSSSIYLAICLLFIAPLIIGGFQILKYLVIPGIICIVVCLLLLSYLILQLVKAIVDVYMTERDRFLIVTDTVSRTVRGEIEGRCSVDAIYFTKYGRYLPDSTVFGLTSENDSFYLVIREWRKNDIVMAFHSMLYEYNDSTP